MEETGRDNKRNGETEVEVPEGTSLRVYLFLLQQLKPVSLSEVRDGARLSTASLASYHLERLSKAGLVQRTPEGFVADMMVLSGFFRARGHLLSTSLFAVGFFATTLALQIIMPWNSWTQLLVFSLLINSVALGYSILRTCQSMTWLQRRLTKTVRKNP